MSKRIISGTSGADDIRCPFYIANGSLDIICQGVIPDTHSIIRYRFKNDKVTQQKLSAKAAITGAKSISPSCISENGTRSKNLWRMSNGSR